MRFRRPALLQRERIFRRQQARIREVRDQAERLPPGRLRDALHSRGKQRGIAAKFVDDEAANQRRILRRQHGFGADEAGDDAAAVDIADQDDRHIRGARKSHIGDVVCPQIDFRGAAGAFDEHEIGLTAQPRKTVEHERQQIVFHLLVGGRLGAAVDPALHHDLRADFALRLQQHRVHVNAGGRARGARLQRLRAPDLAAVRRDRGVVRHVLRLERPHREPAQRERTRQPGDDQGLADIRARALKHKRAGGRHRRRSAQNSMPGWAFTPAEKWCFTSVISVTRSAAAINSGLALRPVTTTCRPSRRAASAATTA